MNKLFEGLGRLVIGILCVAAFIYMVILNGFYNHQANKLERCEKENNVYECELVAVPKEKAE